MRNLFALIGIGFSISFVATGIYISITNQLPNASKEGGGWVIIGLVILGLTWAGHYCTGE